MGRMRVAMAGLLSRRSPRRPNAKTWTESQNRALRTYSSACVNSIDRSPLQSVSSHPNFARAPRNQRSRVGIVCLSTWHLPTATECGLRSHRPDAHPMGRTAVAIADIPRSSQGWNPLAAKFCVARRAAGRTLAYRPARSRTSRGDCGPSAVRIRGVAGGRWRAGWCPGSRRGSQSTTRPAIVADVRWWLPKLRHGDSPGRLGWSGESRSSFGS